MKVFKVDIKGSSPFLMNRFSEEAAEGLKKVMKRGAGEEIISKEEEKSEEATTEENKSIDRSHSYEASRRRNH